MLSLASKMKCLKSWDSLAEFGQIPAETKVLKGDPIFPRLDMEEEVLYIKEQMQGGAPKAEEKVEETIPEVDEITIDDFTKVELRVAQVMEVEPVKKADKLLKLQLDLGYEKRQVVSGIAQHYKPEDLVGKKVICVTNLKPVKLRGELSQGMILAGSQDGCALSRYNRFIDSKWFKGEINSENIKVFHMKHFYVFFFMLLEKITYYRFMFLGHTFIC